MQGLSRRALLDVFAEVRESFGVEFFVGVRDEKRPVAARRVREERAGLAARVGHARQAQMGRGLAQRVGNRQRRLWFAHPRCPSLALRVVRRPLVLVAARRAWPRARCVGYNSGNRGKIKIHVRAGLAPQVFARARGAALSRREKDEGRVPLRRYALRIVRSAHQGDSRRHGGRAPRRRDLQRQNTVQQATLIKKIQDLGYRATVGYKQRGAANNG